MSDTKFLTWDERFNAGCVDDVDAVQRLRREVGNDPTVRVDMHLSAWALDQLLGALEFTLRYAKGEVQP